MRVNPGVTPLVAAALLAATCRATPAPRRSAAEAVEGTPTAAPAAAAALPEPEPEPEPPDLAPLRRGPDGAVEVSTPAVELRVTFPAPGVARVRTWPAGAEAPEASYAVSPAPEAPLSPEAVEQRGEVVTVRGGGIAVRVNRRTLAFALLEGGRPTLEAPGQAVFARAGGSLAFALRPGERVYGLGDKVPGLDRRGRRFDLWNYSAAGWRSDTDPLYKSIPFVVLLDEGRAAGLFVDSAARAHVDVGAGREDRLSWEVDRGAFDLYLLAGPDPRAVISAYTGLTGRAPLPPRWALGYHQSRYSYGSEAEVRALLRRFQRERFPLDAVWLDIDFQRRLAPFRIDRRKFPHLEQLVRDLLRAGVRTVLITDPHVARTPGADPYRSGSVGDHFVHDPDGPGPFLGRAWPGESAFPEFTLARTRAWWGSLYRPYLEAGVAGFWDDMNEPELFNVLKSMPERVRHRLEGGGSADHVSVHNAYGLLQARATAEGLLSLRPGARPFVLTRAGYAGAQRWAATWTGDNRADREGLALSISTLLGLSTSGWAFAGADVGGFLGCPDAGLLTEWTELGALQPFFRNHSDKAACRREPWVNGPTELARRRAAVQRRYRLLPFLYTLFEEASRTGLPVMRPPWLEHPSDLASRDEDRAFLLGRDLLVAPKLVDGDGPYQVVLPAGEWFDVASGERRPGGPATLAPPPGGSVRLFARAGAIVPEGPLVAHAADRPEGPLTLEVWPGPECRGELYLDAGEGFGYRSGELRRLSFTCTPIPEGMEVTSTSAGSYPTWWSAIQVVVHGVPRPPTATGTAVEVTYDAARQAATATVPGGGAEFTVRLSW